MGNNPVMGVDSDGAYTKFGAWIRALFTQGVSTSDIYQSGSDPRSRGFNAPGGQEYISYSGNYQTDLGGSFSSGEWG